MLRKMGRVLFTRWWLVIAVCLGLCSTGCFFEGGHWHHHHHYDDC